MIEPLGHPPQSDSKHFATAELRDVPPVRVGGFAGGAGFRSHPALELFSNGEAMRLSRWLNNGFVKIVEALGQTPQTGHNPAGFKGGAFTCDGDRPARWNENRDILLYGYAAARLESMLPE